MTLHVSRTFSHLKSPEQPKSAKPTLSDSPFTIKFGLFLVALTTFVLPILLFLPFIIAKLLGFALTDYIGMTNENFGVYIVGAQSIGLLVSIGLIAEKLKSRGYSWSAVGLKKFRVWKSVRWIVGYYLIILGALVALSIIVTLLGISSPAASGDEKGGTKLLNFMGSFGLTFVLTVVLAPIVEEVIFRGVLLGAIAKRFGVIAGILVSSLLFTLVHLDPLQMLSAFPLGVYLAIMYYKTGSIYPGIILHASWNLFILLIAQSAA